MTKKLNQKPFRFTPDQDAVIWECFNLISTDKLSLFLNIEKDKIVTRYHQLKNERTKTLKVPIKLRPFISKKS